MRRVAVTGIGVIAPGGVTRGAFWERVTGGRSAVRRTTFFDPSGLRSQIAAQCDFDPYAAGLTDQEVRRMSRYVQFGVAAALEAVEDSELDLEAVDHDRMGVCLGTALGGVMELEEEYVVASNRGRSRLVDPEYASPFLYHALVPSTLASEVALKVRAHGPAITVSTGFTAGIDAVGHGYQAIEEGEADIVIAGGAEAPISPLTVAAFDAIHVTSGGNDDPEHASRPFDRDRDGFVVGEGAAVFVLEDLERVQARDGHMYGEIIGYAGRAAAYHMTGLKTGGLDLAEAIADAMQGGGVAPDDIDYICAHGAGTKGGDRWETAAYVEAFSDRAGAIPISSIKATIGHALGAGGALQIAAGALAIEHGVVPPTTNWEHADAGCDLDFTPDHAVARRIDVALCTGFSFGGFQSALLLARPGARGEARR